MHSHIWTPEKFMSLPQLVEANENAEIAAAVASAELEEAEKKMHAAQAALNTTLRERDEARARWQHAAAESCRIRAALVARGGEVL